MPEPRSRLCLRIDSAFITLAPIMRTQEALAIIYRYSPLIKFTASTLQGKVSLTGLDQLRLVVDELGRIPFLQPLASNIQRLAAFRLSEGVIVESHVAMELSSHTARLSEMCESMRSLLERSTIAQSPEAISIKLPTLSSLGELSTFVKSMELIFDVPVRRLTGDGVRFSGFDIGSNWLILGPETVDYAAQLAKQAAPVVAAVTTTLVGLNRVSAFIFNFLQRFQAWRVDLLRYKTMVAQADSYQGTLKIADSLREMQAQIAEQQKNLAVQQLIDAQALDATPEAIAEARNAASIAMTELQKWVLQGTEVHSALNAPNEIHKLLPAPVTGIIPEPKALPPHIDSNPEQVDKPNS